MEKEVQVIRALMTDILPIGGMVRKIDLLAKGVSCWFVLCSVFRTNLSFQMLYIVWRKGKHQLCYQELINTRASGGTILVTEYSIVFPDVRIRVVAIDNKEEREENIFHIEIC